MQRRQAVTAGISITASLMFVCLIAPLVQAHDASITASIQSSYNKQEPAIVYDGPNAVTSAFYQMADSTKNTANAAKVYLLSAVMTVSSSITAFDKVVVNGTQKTASFTVHGIATGVVATAHVVGNVIGFTGHIGGKVFGVFHVPSILGSVVHPKDTTVVPTITQLRIQQAAIIQSGTKKVSIAALANGVGGACDNGSGSGGYPAYWCNSPMDTVATVPYTRDRINRECTSYAYWYFTSIDGHTDFHVTGNAKYWAYNSNYPTHSSPAVGAIAVETGGAYGHVAVVQALQGQKFEGRTVPTGYVLVSEMNYDWQGHFRYSYSPIGKFSAYIYK